MIAIVSGRAVRRSLLVAAVFMLGEVDVAVAASTPSSGDGSQTGDGSTAYTGLAQAPEANLFVGSATTAVPILVPPGRHSVTPTLALSYASNGGAGPYGYGWDLPLPRIQRATKHGALLCLAEISSSVPQQWLPLADPLRDEFVLSMPGATIECRRQANGTCEPRIEEAFMRIKYDGANKTFVVWDKGGTKFTFGEAQRATAQETGEPGGGAFTLPARTGSSLTNEFALVDAENPIIYPRCEYIYSWALTSVEDPHGNRMEIRYRLLHGVLYPHKVIYGGNDAASRPHLFTVAFAWEGRPGADRPSFSIGGFQATVKNRLESIDVSYAGQPVRTYVLAYEDERLGRQSMLAGVSLKGSDGSSVLLRADGAAAAATFAYRDTSAPGFDGALQLPAKPTLGAPANALRWYDDGETKRDVFDINGDGFADLVDTAPCAGNASWKVYLGSRNGFGSSFICWQLPNPSAMSVIRGKGIPGQASVKRATLDITGDGVADFIDARQVPWIVYKGFKHQTGGGFSAGVSWASAHEGVQALGVETSPTGTTVIHDLIDMNGDGRVDSVLRGGTGATYWIWYANTGTGFAVDTPQRFNTAGMGGLELSLTEDNNGMRWGTFDINGDGFPDHVKAGPTAWTVCLNTGRELGACTAWPVPSCTPQGPVPTCGAEGYIRKSIATESQDTVRDFFDINGDGLPDIVDKTHWATTGTWSVLLNRGAGFATSTVQWLLAPRFIRNGSSGGGGVMEDTFDIDGDGLVDHVIFDGSAGGQGQYGIRRQFDGAWTSAPEAPTVNENPNGLRPDLLVLSEAGSGGSTVLGYRPSTQWSNTALPFNIWTLTDLVHRDGLCPPASLASDGSCAVPGHEVGTTFTYQGGLYDSVERAFRGFSPVQTEAVVDDDETPHPASLTFFHQTAALSGRISQVWAWDGSGASASFLTKPISIISNVWECAKPSNGSVSACPATPAGDLWVRLKSATTTTFSDFSLVAFEQHGTVNDTWHSCAPAGGGSPKYYGNVAHAYRGAGSGGPQLHTHTEYACLDTANAYLVDRPIHVTVRDEASSVLEERWYWYDGANGDGGYGTVTKGAVTRSDALVDVNDTAPAPACARTPATAGGCVKTFMTVDAVGNVTSATDGLGRTTDTTYDADGLYPQVVLHPAPAAGQARHRVKTVYDPRCGAVVEQTIPYTTAEPSATERARTQYDLFCRASKTWLPGDPSGGTPFEQMTYQVGAPATPSQSGAPTGMRTARREPSNSGGIVVSTMLADGLGRPIQSKTQMVVDGTLRKVASRTVAYDARGNARTVHEPFITTTADFTYHSPSAAVAVTTFELDALGRATRIDAPGPGYRTVNHSKAWETTTDDECAATGACAAGRVTERRDALGRTVERLRYSNGALKERTRFEYDAQNRLRATTQGNGSGWNAQTRVETVYDTLGRRVEVRDPDSGTWRYRYDRAGALIFQDDPTPDRHIALCYDAMGRVTKKQYVPQADYLSACGGNTQEQVTYQYTTALYGLGRPSQITDQTGTTIFAEYTVRGQPTIVRRVMQGVTAETRYAYDSAGKVYSMLYPDGEAVIYEYDEVGAPFHLRADGGPTYLQSVTYDIYGRVRVLTHGNGATDTRTYQPAADAFRLARIRSSRAGATVFNYAYDGYTATGLLESLIDDGWSSGMPAEMDATASYAYDGLGRMLTATDVAVRPYEYDDWGNLRRNDGVTLTYGNAARPHQATAFGGGGTVGHDGNGNRSQRLGGASADHVYEYDWDDRVRRVVVNGGSAVELGYDAAGMRTIERRGMLDSNGALVNPEVTRFYSDVYQVNGTTAYKYYAAGGMLIASRRAAAPASLQVASGPAGPVQVAGVWAGGPAVWIGLTSPAAAGLGAGLAAGVGVLLLVPMPRRRRLGMGWHAHPAEIAVLITAVLAATLPVPVLVRPAAALCEPEATPTPTPGPAQALHHYHLDHLGSVQAITAGDGTVLRQTRYHPYGAIRGRWLAAADDEQDRREFTAYYSEPLSELAYAGARLYDPKLGSFLTHDPAGQFASPYAYGPWSPLNGSDPTGRFWVLLAGLTSELFLTTAAVGFAAGFAAQAAQAAINGASVGDALAAGVEGGALAAISAGLAEAILVPTLTAVVAETISVTAGELVGPALFAGGLGQAGYGLSQGDFSGVIGLGVSIGVGFAIAQGANGPAQQGIQVATGYAKDVVSDARGGLVQLPELVVYGNKAEGLESPLIDPVDILAIVAAAAIGGVAGLAVAGVVVGGRAIAARAGSNLVASNGTRIVGFTRHGIDRVIGDGASRAGVRPEALLNALKNPSRIVEGLDNFGRPFQVFHGLNARVVINPQTGRIVSTNPLSSAGAH